MDLKLNKKHVVIFDLDDTLYKEIEYLKSAFREIADRLFQEIEVDIYSEMIFLYQDNKDVFGQIISKFDIQSYSKEELIEWYRFHNPKIELARNALNLLRIIKKKAFALCIMTDGRSITQRNKIKSLGLTKTFDQILISEEFGSSKPSKANYNFFEETYPGKTFVYLGDNAEKDFVSANELGWTTICLEDDGSNIHQQRKVPPKFRPTFYIKSFENLNFI